MAAAHINARVNGLAIDTRLRSSRTLNEEAAISRIIISGRYIRNDSIALLRNTIMAGQSLDTLIVATVSLTFTRKCFRKSFFSSVFYGDFGSVSFRKRFFGHVKKVPNKRDVR